MPQDGEAVRASAAEAPAAFDAAETPPPAPLDLSKDGIAGREVPWSSVPTGNDAFQYAIGTTEDGGSDAVYRRRADERGTYGGWRWEAEAPPATQAAAILDAAPDPFADNYAALNGKTITQQVLVADTGKTATLRMDAGQALRDVNEREAALLKLKACIGR